MLIALPCRKKRLFSHLSLSLSLSPSFFIFTIYVHRQTDRHCHYQAIFSHRFIRLETNYNSEKSETFWIISSGKTTLNFLLFFRTRFSLSLSLFSPAVLSISLLKRKFIRSHLEAVNCMQAQIIAFLPCECQDGENECAFFTIHLSRDIRFGHRIHACLFLQEDVRCTKR